MSFVAVREIFRNAIRVMRLLWTEKKWTILGLLTIGLVSAAIPFASSGTQGPLINDISFGIEDGAIAELGSHEALIAQDRTYARLFRLQAKGYQ